MSLSIQIFTNYFFGKGKWIGKGFNITDENGKGDGYNIFNHKNEIKRQREFNTYSGTSKIDDRESFHLVYAKFNRSPLVHSMRDEIRKINDNLYLGMGYTIYGFGSINPGFFVLLHCVKFE